MSFERKYVSTPYLDSVSNFSDQYAFTTSLRNGFKLLDT